MRGFTRGVLVMVTTVAFAMPAWSQVDTGRSRVRPAQPEVQAPSETQSPAPQAEVSGPAAQVAPSEAPFRDVLARTRAAADRAPPAFRSRGSDERLALATRLGVRVSSRLAPFTLTPNAGHLANRGGLSFWSPSSFYPRDDEVTFREGRGSIFIFLHVSPPGRFIVDCDITSAGSALHIYMENGEGGARRVWDEPLANGRLSFLTPETDTDIYAILIRWPDAQPETTAALWRFHGCEVTPVEPAG